MTFRAPVAGLVLAAALQALPAVAGDAATVTLDNASGEQLCFQEASMDNATLAYDGLTPTFGMQCLKPGETGATLTVTAQGATSSARAEITVSCLPGLHATGLGTLVIELVPDSEPVMSWQADPQSPCNTAQASLADGVLSATSPG